MQGSNFFSNSGSVGMQVSDAEAGYIGIHMPGESHTVMGTGQPFTFGNGADNSHYITQHQSSRTLGVNGTRRGSGPGQSFTGGSAGTNRERLDLESAYASNTSIDVYRLSGASPQISQNPYHASAPNTPHNQHNSPVLSSGHSLSHSYGHGQSASFSGSFGPSPASTQPQSRRLATHGPSISMDGQDLSARRALHLNPLGLQSYPSAASPINPAKSSPHISPSLGASPTTYFGTAPASPSNASAFIHSDSMRYSPSNYAPHQSQAVPPPPPFISTSSTNSVHMHAPRSPSVPSNPYAPSLSPSVVNSTLAQAQYAQLSNSIKSQSSYDLSRSQSQQTQYFTPQQGIIGSPHNSISPKPKWPQRQHGDKRHAFRRVRDAAELAPMSNAHPLERRADPNGGFISVSVCQS